MSAAWPAVKAHLLTALPALLPDVPGWSSGEVYNGPPVTRDAPPSYVTVGFVVGEDFGGSYEQTRNGEGGWQGALVEQGSVRCEVVCATGDVDLPTVEARAFALVDAWDALIAEDETLGGTLPASSSASLAVDVQPLQTDKGSVQRLTVTLSYFSRGFPRS